MSSLTDAQRALLRLSLVRLEGELRSSHEASADAAAPVELDQPIGRVSRVDAIQQQRMVQANRATMQRRLALVRTALQRFDEDAYGICVTCGEDVDFRRLEAQPESPFCIACQSARERRI